MGKLFGADKDKRQDCDQKKLGPRNIEHGKTVIMAEAAGKAPTPEPYAFVSVPAGDFTSV